MWDANNNPWSKNYWVQKIVQVMMHYLQLIAKWLLLHLDRYFCSQKEIHDYVWKWRWNKWNLSCVKYSLTSLPFLAEAMVGINSQQQNNIVTPTCTSCIIACTLVWITQTKMHWKTISRITTYEHNTRRVTQYNVLF